MQTMGNHLIFYIRDVMSSDTCFSVLERLF